MCIFLNCFERIFITLSSSLMVYPIKNTDLRGYKALFYGSVIIG